MVCPKKAKTETEVMAEQEEIAAMFAQGYHKVDIDEI